MEALSGSLLIRGSGVVILVGLFMMILPWAVPFPESLEGKVLVSMFGFFFLIGTIFLFIASLSAAREGV